jgi:hypothetical protein
MSNDDVDRPTADGNILRHKPRESDFTHPEHFAIHCDEIEAHLAKHVGPMHSVFHELISDLVHLDVLWVHATRERPFHLLVTSGMGDLPMTVPEGFEDSRHAEVFMALPADWKVGEDAEDHYWPIRWLKQIGRLPHEYQTWIGDGHTIPNGDPPEPIANTKFVGVMATATYPFPDEFFRLTTRDGATISFYQLVPLYAEEMDLKLEKGSGELESRFGKQNIDFVLDARRPNVALKRGWWKW